MARTRQRRVGGRRERETLTRRAADNLYMTTFRGDHEVQRYSLCTATSVMFFVVATFWRMSLFDGRSTLRDEAATPDAYAIAN